MDIAKSAGARRIIALILSVVMILSNISTAAIAADETVYCGLDHEHDESCYVAPNGSDADPTDATETPTEATEDPTDATEEPTDAVDDPTEATEEPTEAAANPADTTEEPTDAADNPTEATNSPANESEDDGQQESTEIELDVDDYYFFDLYAGNVTISSSGGNVQLTGYRYDGNENPQEIKDTVPDSEKIRVYVYQSNHATDHTKTGLIGGAIVLPNTKRVDGWGEYITNRTDVEEIIASWIDKNRPSTNNRIIVSGKLDCELVIDNLYSTYQSRDTSKDHGGVSFIPGASVNNSSLTLLLKGDNRFGNVFYSSAKNAKNKIVFENYPNQEKIGTVTVANVKKNTDYNYWCSAIGGNDNSMETSDGIYINSGIIFAGTNAADDCTAIGGGGNGYGGITINGGTVTAVVTSSGAAIGGGIGKTAQGGSATVNISGGTIYAYNFSCKSGTYSQKGVKYIPAAAIGGGSSARAICNASVINISGGTIYAQSVGGTAIGGGSSSDNNGGDTTVNISGGIIEAYSIPGMIDGQEVPAGVAIGGGTGYNKGGSATLNVTGNATLRTGSIGGGGFGNKSNADGVIGPAEVTISAGNIRGQIVMEGTGSFFEMSGGTINNEIVAGVDYNNCYFVKPNGGAACVETGTVTISDSAVIRNASATCGGAIFLSNGNVTMNNGIIANCSANLGGAVYVTGGNFTMSGGNLGEENGGNTATEGGAVYVNGGAATITGGNVQYNTATNNGGAIYVTGGNFTITGGTVSHNQVTAADGEGGAVYVTGGNIFVGTEGCTENNCLSVSGNHACNGGAFAVAGATPVMYCGTLTGNTATDKGGAIYVSGQGGFTMYGGLVDGGGASTNAQYGGGVYLAGGTFTLEGDSAYIQNNHATDGAGVYLAGGQPVLRKGFMNGNVATGNGGGIYINQQNVVLNPTGNVTIQGNEAVDGAGMYISGTQGQNAGFSLADGSQGKVTFAGNIASGNGGGVCLSYGDMTITNDSIALYGNEAANGGGAAVLNGNFNISGGSIGQNEQTKNEAENGGGIYVSGGNVTVTASATIENNKATNGGGVYLTGGKFYLDGNNASIENNEATDGGGVYLNQISPTLNLGSIKDNTATGNGGGIYINQQNVVLNPTGNVTIQGNSAVNGAGMYIGGTEDQNAGFSLAEGSYGEVLFVNNIASGYGGGVCLYYGDMAITNDSIALYDNEATNGGGAAVLNGNFNISGGSVGVAEQGQNEAINGGGIYVSGGNVNVKASATIENNKATNGGGVYLTGGNFVLEGNNASIESNEATDGGGVYLNKINPDLNKGSIKNNIATGNGGGIYINQQNVVLNPTGNVTIQGNSAVNGAGMYISGTQGQNAGFSLADGSQGKVTFAGNIASGNGGGVCLSHGNMSITNDRIAINGNEAANGGGAAVLDGNFEISGGTIENNKANANGGGISVSNGNITMSGGTVEGNQAVTGSGGGMYIASKENEVKVRVFSGKIHNNSAAVSGGAVFLEGGTNNNILVQIGVNLLHEYVGNTLKSVKHDSDGNSADNGNYIHSSCPEITNNSASKSGGAFYITGGARTNLNIFCLVESGNNCDGDLDINNNHLSDFLMVDGGKVKISTAADGGICDSGHDHENGSFCDSHSKDQNSNHGHAEINGSIHVAGGILELFGDMKNPSFQKPITVDLTKQEDYYRDHRYSTEFVKLSYHENFDMNGEVDSTQTAIDIPVNTTHTISNSIYKHEGYEIYGWNTSKDADINTSDGWYDVGKTYTFVVTKPTQPEEGKNYQEGNLILYAIWKPNGYTIQFDPNPPEGVAYTGEKMPDQQFTYNEEKPLNECTYRIVGYVFTGWTVVGTEEVLPDQARIFNKTSVSGGTVVLKANWVKCDHKDTEITYHANSESAQKAVLTKKCTKCQYEATITLTAEDTVYDKAEHGVNLVYSDEAWFKDGIDVAYEGYKIDAPAKTEKYRVAQSKISAGNYTASVTAGGETASVTYQIAKARQPAPDSKPEYIAPTGNDVILKIHKIAADESTTTRLRAEYIARYYDNGVLKSTDWYNTNNGAIQTMEVTLDAPYRYYFVSVRYQGDDNYLPSDEVTADSTFFFRGNIELKFIADPGITYQITEDKDGFDGLTVSLTLGDDYYLVNGKWNVQDNDALELITVSEVENNQFTIKASQTPGSIVVVEIHIGTAKKKLKIDSAIEENQVFGNVTDTENPEISRDSAFTVAYDVKNFDSIAYKPPVLKFSSDIPNGTSIILVRRINGSNTYWSYTWNCSDETTEITPSDEMTENLPSIVLTEFTRMGDTEKFAAADGDAILQFVVDFSNTADGYSGTELTTTLECTPLSDSNGAQTISAQEKVNVSDTQFTLTNTGGEGLIQNIAYEFTSQISASKWDHRNLSLIVEIADLPFDAYISAKVNGATYEIEPYAAGKFIIPLGSALSGNVVLELMSEKNIFPIDGKAYTGKCSLYASKSIADRASANGDLLSDVECSFTSTSRKAAVKVTHQTDKRVYVSADDITVTVDSIIPASHVLMVKVEQRDLDESYVNTNRKSTQVEKQHTFSLDGCEAGYYRIIATIERENGFVVQEACYYFVIE